MSPTATIVLLWLGFAGTQTILRDLGYTYDASLGHRTRPTRLASGLMQVPFVWPGVDGFHYLRDLPADPEAVRDTWMRVLAKTAEEGGLVLLICHAFITGTEALRLAALESVIAAAQADPRVAVKTAAEVASWSAGGPPATGPQDP